MEALDLLIAMVEAGLIRRNTGAGSITYSLVAQPTGQSDTARQPTLLDDCPVRR